MKITPGNLYRIKGDSDYFQKKYETYNPSVKIEGRVIDLFGKSVNEIESNFICELYKIRMERDCLPIDGDVYYGSILGQKEFVHETELEEVNG